MRKIRENSVPDLMIKGIDGGEKLTVSEWAKKLGKPESHIRQTLTSLRRRNFQFYPRPAEVGQQGAIVDISNSVRDTRNTMERFSTNHVKPNINAVFALVVNAVETFPQLSETAQELAESMLVKIIESKRKLLASPKE